MIQTQKISSSRVLAFSLLFCLSAPAFLLGQSTATTQKSSEKAAAKPRMTAGLVTSTQLTQWMKSNGVPKGPTATINQWEYAMNKLIPGGWESYHVNFLNPAYQGKRDPTEYTADQFLNGLKAYEAAHNQKK